MSWPTGAMGSTGTGMGWSPQMGPEQHCDIAQLEQSLLKDRKRCAKSTVFVKALSTCGLYRQWGWRNSTSLGRAALKQADQVACCIELSVPSSSGSPKWAATKTTFVFLSPVPGNVMTLKFLSDASVTAGGFQIRYVTMDVPSKAGDGKNTTSQGRTNFLSGKFGIMWAEQHGPLTGKHI